jgi:hypothetical protein
MQQRRGTLAEWNDPVIAASVILQAGEVGLETDTGRFKIGNGTSVWQSLPYYLPDNNPSNVTIRQGKNLHDVYAKLSPLAESYSQTFTGSQVLVPNAADRTPLVVAGVAGQTGILQLWRTSAGATLASMDHTGKLTAAGGGIFSGQVDVNNNKVVNVGTPTNAKDAATKEYVDELAQGLSIKPAVQAATTENLDGVYDNGVDGIGSTLTLPASATLEIDGWDTWDELDGILVKDQTDKFENGRYFVSQVGDATTEWILDRCPACDTPEEIPSSYVFVQHGDTYESTGWIATVDDLATFEVGVDDINWVQFSGAGTFTAGDGLVLDGPEFNVVGTENRITVNADSIDIASNYSGQDSIDTVGTIYFGVWEASTIDETKGGTGQTSYTVGDILYADTDTSLAKLSPGTASYALLSGGSGAAPSYGQVPTAGIANDAVTYDKLQNVSGQYRVLGRISTGAGNAEELTPDQLMETINQGITDISFNLLPVGTTSTTVAQGDHTHTLDQLSDVVISGTPAIRQVIKYDGTNWINELPSGGISIGATAPTDASSGDAWFDSTDGSLYVYYDDGVGGSRTNIITNPSFETTTYQWYYYGQESLTLNSSEYYSGEKSALVTYTSGDESIEGYDATTYYESPLGVGVEIVENQDYTMSAYIKQASAPGSAQIVTIWRDSSYDFIGSAILSSPTSTNTSSWTRVSTTETAPEGAAYLLFGIRNLSNHYIDAAMIEQSSTLESYIEGSVSGGGNTAQWVQVKANSALEASILTRVSALEARSTDIEAANAVRVADEEDRDSVYPAPVQGNTVFRADLGYEEKYYAAYNATTNPDGTTGTPGWYQYAGGAPLSQNYLINSAFEINQRNFTSVTGINYGFDRWQITNTGDGTGTYSAQTFSSGQTPLSNYEFGSYARVVTTGQTQTTAQTRLNNRIEDVKTLAGKTVTVSFWAKAASGSPKVTVGLSQVFGTGGSTAVETNAGQVTLSTSWTRYVTTADLPSITGKTVGPSSQLLLALVVSAGSDVSIGFGMGLQSNTFDIWGVQLEEGPVATPFRRNQPNIQAELAACQRYYVRYAPTGAYQPVSFGFQATTTTAISVIHVPVEMRIVPTVAISQMDWSDDVVFLAPITSISVPATSDKKIIRITSSYASNGAQFRPGMIRSANTSTAFLELNAEL